MSVFNNSIINQLVEQGISQPLAEQLSEKLQTCNDETNDAQRWTRISTQILSPDIPFVVHQLLFEENYRERSESDGPPPAWSPGEAEQQSNLARLLQDQNGRSEKEFAEWSCTHQADFWQLMVKKTGIRFRTPPSEIVDLSQGEQRPNWFSGAILNIAESCFQADPDAIAVIYQDFTGTLQKVTYQQLDHYSNRVAASLSALGMRPGDAAGLLLPMTLEAVAIYLGIIKAGCCAVSIADSFASPEIERRLQIGKAKLVFTQDVVLRNQNRLPLYEKLHSFDAPQAIVIPALKEELPSSLRTGDRLFDDFLIANDQFDVVPRSPSDHTNVLFSSGTTGDPKAIPWTHTTPIKAATDGYLYQDVQPGDVVVWPTNMGWMMGPWLIYASLINKATIGLYYDHPASSGFCQFVQDAKVNVLGVIPSLVAAWKAKDLTRGLDWNSIKTFSSTGECSNPTDMLYLMSQASYRPVIEYCGGTEIGGGYITGTLLHPASPSTFTTVTYGLSMTLINDAGESSDRGEVFLRGPAIGLSTDLLNRDHHEVYFSSTPDVGEGELRRHGDELERLPHGYYRVLGRSDDTMNLGGIKVSAVELERVVNEHPAIQESAAVAVSDKSGGPGHLVIFAVLDPEATATPTDLKEATNRLIKSKLNPLFKVSDVVVLEKLPRTASNKVMRRELRAQLK